MITSVTVPLSDHVTVRPDMLLATASATITIEQFNANLSPYGLCLPIAPLEANLTLATIIARNAGGRRRLRYGTILRYLRSATLQDATIRAEALEVIAAPLHDLTFQTLTVGGSTLKRATGYGLNRALIGSGQTLGFGLQPHMLDYVTVNIRPLPLERQVWLITCIDFDAACRLATALLSAKLELSALVMLGKNSAEPYRDLVPIEFPPYDTTLLLIELESIAPVIARQATTVMELSTAIGARVTAQSNPDIAWRLWEMPFQNQTPRKQLSLALTLPRRILSDFVTQAQTIALRYRNELFLWGDLGVGALWFTLSSQSEGETQQAATLIYDTARRLGGAISTEMGIGTYGTTLWRNKTARRRMYSATKTLAVPHTIVTPEPLAVAPYLPSAAHRLIDKLQRIIGPNYVLTRPDDTWCYTQDASISQATETPLVVVLPKYTSEVSTILQLADQAEIPVVTRGAGSGLAGGAIPTPGALLLALTRMRRLSIDPNHRTAHGEAGVITADIQHAAAHHGLFYPPDPSSQSVSTIGGNIACNAGGPRCLKYGVTADYVLGLTAVLADGSIIQVGDGLVGQTPDTGLTQLLIGSEGTLAVLTEATLRLIPQPPTQCTTLAVFNTLEDACTTVEAIMSAGLIPAALELMDDTTITVVKDYAHIDVPSDVGALLLLLADGEPEVVAYMTKRLAELARQGGACSVQTAQSVRDEAALWKARRAIAPALARVKPNRLGEDICVPLHQIANCVRAIKHIAAEHDLQIVVFGHAGDGNLHPNILFDSRDPTQVKRVQQAAADIFHIALALGGTLSGEHGIGTLKRPFMAMALDHDVITLQHAIKAGFDPKGRLNPSKVLP